MVVAFNVDVLKVSSTPLQLLIVVVIVAAVGAFAFFLATIIGAPFVDKRWPADEPLNPIEMLWGESGGYIQRTFRGLDLGTSKDLASQFQEVKYKPGDTIIEQGDPATHFYVIKDGNVEVSQTIDTGAARREDVINQFGPGQSFGETAILRRTARTATVKALTECTVLELTAEDFVAGAALSAAEDNELLARVDTYMQADAARAASAKRTPGIGFLSRDEAPAAAAAAVSATTEWRPTHRVTAEASAWSEPDPAADPTAQLAAGVQVAVLEERGSWAHVAAENGWEGWVDARGLDPL
ncbi:MAG TPA: cyclic nucleotide-binding domain-containing protein [Acidimicrobiales bacterium]|nr:cyclic nucleotide-binding domain-containing protein [Acidimicrobiales bacterium]